MSCKESSRSFNEGRGSDALTGYGEDDEATEETTSTSESSKSKPSEGGVNTPIEGGELSI